jgi:ArsR family transcriptional regulator
MTSERRPTSARRRRTEPAPRGPLAVADLERVFRALGDGTRLRILALLGAGETCVCHIHEGLRLPQPKVSRHLAYLRRAGLVRTRKQGQWVHYRLADHADAVVRTVVATVGHCLEHVQETPRDRAQLGQATGTRVTRAHDDPPAFTCCAKPPQ